MIEIHKYNLTTHISIIETTFKDNTQGLEWVNFLNKAYTNNPYFKNYYWWGVPVYEANISFFVYK